MNIYLWLAAAWLLCGFIGMVLGDTGETLKRGSYCPVSIGMRLIMILWGVILLIIGFCVCFSGIWYVLKPKINKILDFEI